MPEPEQSLFYRRRSLLGGILALPTLPFSSCIAAEKAKRHNLSIHRQWQTENHTLYPFSRVGKTLYINGNATLEAWDITIGQLQWRADLKASATFRPRVSGRFIVCAGRDQLAVYERENGKQLWSYQPGAQLAVPLVTDNRIYIGEGNRLLAINIDTGTLAWEFPITENARIAYAPVEHEGVIYLGPGDGLLYALQSGDGALVWKIDHGSDWQYLRQLYIESDVLVAGGYHDELFGIDPDNGTVLWRVNAGNFVNSQLVADGLTCFWSPTGWIYALNVKSGQVVWRHRTRDYRIRNRRSNWASVMAELVSDGEYLYILAMDNILHVLDFRTGEKQGEYQIPTAVRPFICLGAKQGSFLLGDVTGRILETEAIF